MSLSALSHWFSPQPFYRRGHSVSVVSNLPAVRQLVTGRAKMLLQKRGPRAQPLTLHTKSPPYTRHLRVSLCEPVWGLAGRGGRMNQVAWKGRASLRFLTWYMGHSHAIISLCSIILVWAPGPNGFRALASDVMMLSGTLGLWSEPGLSLSFLCQNSVSDPDKTQEK